MTPLIPRGFADVDFHVAAANLDGFALAAAAPVRYY